MKEKGLTVDGRHYSVQFTGNSLNFTIIHYYWAAKGNINAKYMQMK